MGTAILVGALKGGIIPVLLAAIKGFFQWKTKQEETKQLEAEIEAERAQARVKAEYALQIAKIENTGKIRQAEAQDRISARGSQIDLTGRNLGWWNRGVAFYVDVFRALVRPLIAYATLGLAIYCIIVGGAAYAQDGITGAIPDDVQELLGTVVVFYFGARTVEKLFKP